MRKNIIKVFSDLNAGMIAARGMVPFIAGKRESMYHDNSRNKTIKQFQGIASNGIFARPLLNRRTLRNQNVVTGSKMMFETFAVS